MQTFYTVDRAGSAQPKSNFELITEYSQYDIWTVTDIYDKTDAIKRIDQLYPQGLSKHGVQYLILQGVVIFENGTRRPLQITHTMPMIEAIFELVRQSESSHRPSRMQSMFAWCNLEDARQFQLESGNECAIYEVEANNAFIADQNLLYLGASVIGAYELARKYWSGEQGKNCKLEGVIPLPVTIGNAI